jgi:hypothetical protein
MSWAEALKEYAKQNGQFVVPRKDSEDYKKVKAIQEKMAATKKDAPVVEEPKKKRAKAMPEGVIPKAPVVEAPKETKKKAVNPALACEQLKVQQAAKEQAVEVKAKRARKVKEADSAVDAPKRKPRAKKIEIIKQDVVLEF